MTDDSPSPPRRASGERDPVTGADPFDHRVIVNEADIDFMGHANNARYLVWVQEAVLAHWRSYAPADAIARWHWVALRHNISYRRPAFAGDVIVATVVIEKLSGARAFYNTLIRRGAELLAEVESAWCCVSSATSRPARLTEDVVAAFIAPAAARS